MEQAQSSAVVGNANYMVRNWTNDDKKSNIMYLIYRTLSCFITFLSVVKIVACTVQ